MVLYVKVKTTFFYRIQGSDGTVFPPYIVRQKKPIYMYQKELCRRLPFVFDKEMKILNGRVPVYK